jgi:hypothetical protein
MSDSAQSTNAKIKAAIEQRDATALKAVLLASEFVLISIIDDSGDEEEAGAMTAEIDDFEALVAFSTETRAGEFVGSMDELFEENEDIEGVVVEGAGMLEYLPEGYGILLDPESEDECVIEPSLAAEICAQEE